MLFGDLGVKEIAKAHAIDVLLEHLNAKKADRDAQVDMSIFEYCKQSVCLGNSGYRSKQAADTMAQAVDDGLASAFHQLGLI